MFKITQTGNMYETMGTSVKNNLPRELGRNLHLSSPCRHSKYPLTPRLLLLLQVSWKSRACFQKVHNVVIGAKGPTVCRSTLEADVKKDDRRALLRQVLLSSHQGVQIAALLLLASSRGRSPARKFGFPQDFPAERPQKGTTQGWSSLGAALKTCPKRAPSETRISLLTISPWTSKGLASKGLLEAPRIPSFWLVIPLPSSSRVNGHPSCSTAGLKEGSQLPSDLELGGNATLIWGEGRKKTLAESQINPENVGER